MKGVWLCMNLPTGRSRVASRNAVVFFAGILLVFLKSPGRKDARSLEKPINQVPVQLSLLSITFVRGVAPHAVYCVVLKSLIGTRFFTVM